MQRVTRRVSGVVVVVRAALVSGEVVARDAVQGRGRGPRLLHWPILTCLDRTRVPVQCRARRRGCERTVLLRLLLAVVRVALRRQRRLHGNDER